MPMTLWLATMPWVISVFLKRTVSYRVRSWSSAANLGLRPVHSGDIPLGFATRHTQLSETSRQHRALIERQEP